MSSAKSAENDSGNENGSSFTNLDLEQGILLKTSSTNESVSECVHPECCKVPKLPYPGVAPISRIFIDDLTERRKQWRVPWFLIQISFIQISLYVIGNDCIQQRLMFIPELRTQYWRYLTYMLVHSDCLHLSLNMCLQCLIGFCLENEQGHWKIACIYIAGGICGSLAPLLIQPQISLLGSSAGVYALLLSHLPHMYKNYLSLSHRYLRIFSIGILFLCDIGFTSYHFLVNHNADPRISLEAHVAGGICGLLMGYFLYSSTMYKKKHLMKMSFHV